MTVGELIEKLKQYPADMLVYGGTDHFGEGLEIRHINTRDVGDRTYSKIGFVAAHTFLSLDTEYPGPEPD